MPWNKAIWDTPNVAHDNPKSEHLHSSVMIGFANQVAREEFYRTVAPGVNTKLVSYVSALQAYRIDKTLTFVENSKRKEL